VFWGVLDEEGNEGEVVLLYTPAGLVPDELVVFAEV
jgi:hypothetical protein